MVKKGSYGTIPKPSGKPHQPSIYPYPSGTEISPGGSDKGKKKVNKDASKSIKNPISSPYGLGKDRSREWNKGPIKVKK